MAARAAATALYTILALGYLAAAAGGIVGWRDSPHLGVSLRWTSQGSAIVTRVYPGGAAWEADVRPDDVLIEIDGRPVDESTWDERGDRAFSFAFARPETNDVIHTSTTTGYPYDRATVASLELSGLLFALSSVILFMRTRRPRQIVVLSLFLLVAASALALAPATQKWQPWALFGENLAVVWAIALLFVFFSLFPKPAWRRSRFLALLPMAIVALAATLSSLYIRAVVLAPTLFEIFSTAGFVYMAVGLSGGLALLGFAYKASKSAIEREQLRVIVWGFVLAIVPFVTFSALPRAAGLQFLIRPELTVLLTVLIPISFVYAILRHQLMGIRRLVHRGVAYGTMTLALLAAYGVVVASARLLAGRDLAFSTAFEAGLLVVLFVAVPSMSATRRLALATVDRLLYKQPTDYLPLIRRVSLQAASVSNIPQLGVTVLESVVSTMGLTFAAIIELRGRDARLWSGVGEVPPGLASLGHDMLRRLGTHGSAVAIPLPSAPYRVLACNASGEAEDSLIVCFGPPLAEEPFRPEEIEALETMAGHVSTMVQRLRLIEGTEVAAATLRELNRRLTRAQEQERARIGEYLHSEPIQRLTHLAWQADLLELPTDFREALAGLAHDLREFTALLQPAVLNDLGLVRAVDWLTQQLRERTGADVDLAIEGLEADDRFERDVELAIYRVAQEAMRNCEKHSRATQIWVRLSRDEDGLALTIRDNGVGLRGMGDGGISHLGIAAMRERVEQLDGRFQIGNAEEGSGTLMKAAVWLRPPMEDAHEAERQFET